MLFKKIQRGKNGELCATYTDNDGNVITLKGAYEMHKDFYMALQALSAHLAILAEQREAVGMSLGDIRAMVYGGKENIGDIIKVYGVEFNDGEACILGYRWLRRGEFLKIESPAISVIDDSYYEYRNELALDIDNVIHEAHQYIENKKFANAEGELFTDQDPFEGMDGATVEVVAGEVPTIAISDKETA